jgi:hypothetical protein
VLTKAGFIQNTSSCFGEDVEWQRAFLRGRLSEILYTKNRQLSSELLKLTRLFDSFLNYGEIAVAPRRKIHENCFEKMLRTAVENGHVEIVRALLDNNAPLSADKLGETIAFAALKGHIEIVRMLIDNVDTIREMFRGGLLKYAAGNGWLDIICYLLSHNLTIQEYDLQSAFENAARIGHLGIICELINRYGITASARDCSVVAAAENGHAETIRKLLEDNAVISGINRGNAVVRAAKNGHVQAVRALLQNCSPQIIEHRETYSGDSQLDVIIAMILHANDNNVTHIELHRGLAVENAVEIGDIEIIRELMRGATISRFCMGNAMESAAKKQRLDIVEELSMH